LKRASSKKEGKGHKGLTVTGLLVAVGILVALPAILVPGTAYLAEAGKKKGAGGELASVQAALDAAITDLQLSAVEANAAGVSDLSSAGGGNIDPGGGTVYLYPKYLRFKLAHYPKYIWDNTGLVSRVP